MFPCEYEVSSDNEQRSRCASVVSLFYCCFYQSTELKIGDIGVDECAYEQQQVGKCSNRVDASSAFTVVSGDFGQVEPTPASSLTVVSIDITLRAVYTSIIPPDGNCTTGTPCLHGGTCHNAVPKGIICQCGREYRGPECQSTTRTFKNDQERSYIWLEKLVAYERSSVSLQFITGTANGLLLYQGPLYEGNSYFKLLLKAYSCSQGAGLVIQGPVIRKPLNVNPR